MPAINGFHIRHLFTSIFVSIKYDILNLALQSWGDNTYFGVKFLLTICPFLLNKIPSWHKRVSPFLRNWLGVKPENF